MDPQLTKTNHWCNKVQFHDRNSDGVGYFFRDWRLWDWRTNSIRIQKQNTVLPPFFFSRIETSGQFFVYFRCKQNTDLWDHCWWVLFSFTHLTILGFALDKKSREMHQNLSCFFNIVFSWFSWRFLIVTVLLYDIVDILTNTVKNPKLLN